jgi:hypothetical protein
MTRVAVVALLSGVVGAVALPTQVPAGDPEFAAFLEGTPLDPGVQDGLALFRQGSPGPLPAAYVDALPTAMRQKVVGAAIQAQSRLSEGACEPSIDVSYPGAGSSGVEPGEGDSAKRFEDSFVRVEMIACFEGTDVSPGVALAMYTEADFRMEASSRIREIVEEDGLSCVATDGVPVLLDPSRACNRITQAETPDWASQHSQVVKGESGSGFQPTYFKESIKTFVRIPEGLGLHYINYTRSTGLNGLKKRIARGKAADSQREQVELLASLLGATLR